MVAVIQSADWVFYVISFDSEAKYFIQPQEYQEGQPFRGGGARSVAPNEKHASYVRALDPQTGDLVWEFPIAPTSRSGLLSTAGDLVFGGSVDGYVFALDAERGEEMWHIPVGARIQAAPLSYMVADVQYVSIAAGNVVFTFGLAD